MKRTTILWTSLAGCAALFAAVYSESDAVGAARAGAVRQALPRGEIVKFKNSKSGRCMGVQGELVKQFTCKDTPSQQWQVEGLGAAQAYKNVQSGKCLGVDRAQTTKGANIGQYDCDRDYNAPNQSWELVGLRGSMVRRIVNQKSTEKNHRRFCIGVDWASTKNGIQLKQFPCDDISMKLGRPSNQDWQVLCLHCSNTGP